MVKNAYCSYCGTKFETQAYPRTCVSCHVETYLNPSPISVSMIRVWKREHDNNSPSSGILVIKRNIEPMKGQWAFPGGYLEVGETWQAGAVREVREEVGLDLPEELIKLHSVQTASSNGNLLIFNTTDKIVFLDDIKFKPNHEVSDVKVIYEPCELAFPTHTECLKSLFFKMK